MKKLFVGAVLCFTALCLFNAPADAETDNGSETVRSRFVTISLFKNGLGFVYSEAELAGEAGRILISPIPEPVHGTFWLYPVGEGVSIQEARAFQKESTVTETSPAGNMTELLTLNADKKVVIHTGGRPIVGKIVSVSSGLVLLHTDAGIIPVHTGQVQQINVIDGELKTHSEKESTVKKNVIEITAEDSSGGGRLGMQYLTKGITWAPSVSVDITDPEKARLLANAEIINEIGDLEDVTVKFVSGFPNFQFSGVVSPIALQGNLASFLSSLARPAGMPHAAVMRQMLGVSEPRARMEARPVSGYAVDPEGMSVEDLFFYEREGVTLGRGERGYYPLYEMKVPYEHVYRWSIPDFIDAQDRYRQAVRDEDEEEVWHILRLTNTGNIPWTTSPAMITRSGQVLGQDTLRYTSPGADTNLPITRAMDIRAEQEEFEISRERAAARFYGTHYDLVEVSGILKATNYKDEEVVLSISKILSGEVVSAAYDPGIEMIARGLRRVNPTNRLSWEIPLGAGEDVEIEYRYKVYVRG